MKDLTFSGKQMGWGRGAGTPAKQPITRQKETGYRKKNDETETISI